MPVVVVRRGEDVDTGDELMPLRMSSSIHSFDSLLARLVVCL